MTRGLEDVQEYSQENKKNVFRQQNPRNHINKLETLGSDELDSKTKIASYRSYSIQ